MVVVACTWSCPVKTKGNERLPMITSTPVGDQGIIAREDRRLRSREARDLAVARPDAVVAADAAATTAAMQRRGRGMRCRLCNSLSTIGTTYL